MPELPIQCNLAVGLVFAWLTSDAKLLKTMAMALHLLLSGRWITQRHRYGYYILLGALQVFFTVVFNVNAWDPTFRRKYLLLVTSASLVTTIGCLIASWRRGDRLTALFCVFSVLLAVLCPSAPIPDSGNLHTFPASQHRSYS
ncbi:MAG: hypothetical protein EBZ67_00620 [Chitinophagia bacterium]|nr:hypothetical protein [Chitinophagia bacterium]